MRLEYRREANAARAGAGHGPAVRECEGGEASPPDALIGFSLSEPSERVARTAAAPPPDDGDSDGDSARGLLQLEAGGGLTPRAGSGLGGLTLLLDHDREEPRAAAGKKMSGAWMVGLPN